MLGLASFKTTRILSAMGLTILLAAAAVSQVRYSTYSNGRFGYSIDYPSSLLAMERAPENDDGRTFRSKDGSVEMRVWGQYNVLFSTLGEYYANSLRVLDGKPTYSKLGERDYAFSGYRKGKIYYERLYVATSADGDTYLTFTVEYPKTKRSTWDPIVAHIARSLKSIPLGQ